MAVHQAPTCHLSRATSVHATVVDDGADCCTTPNNQLQETQPLSAEGRGRGRAQPAALVRAATMGESQHGRSTGTSSFQHMMITSRHSAHCRLDNPDAVFSRSAATYDTVLPATPPSSIPQTPPFALPSVLPGTVLPSTGTIRRVHIPPSPFQAAASQALQDASFEPGSSTADGNQSNKNASVHGPPASALSTCDHEGSSPHAQLGAAAYDGFSAHNAARVSSSDHSSYAAVADITLVRNQLEKAPYVRSSLMRSSAAGDNFSGHAAVYSTAGSLQHQPSNQQLLTPACSILIGDSFDPSQLPASCTAHGMDLDDACTHDQGTDNDSSQAAQHFKAAGAAVHQAPPCVRGTGSILCGWLACVRPQHA